MFYNRPAISLTLFSINGWGMNMFAKQRRKSIGLTIKVVLAAGAFATSVSAQESDARALLGRMSSEIAGLESFIIRGDAYTDARLGAGQIIEHASEVTMRVHRCVEQTVLIQSFHLVCSHPF